MKQTSDYRVIACAVRDHTLFVFHDAEVFRRWFCDCRSMCDDLKVEWVDGMQIIERNNSACTATYACRECGFYYRVDSSG